MADDIVEAAQIRRQVADALAVKGDVAQAELPDDPLRALDLSRRVVHADEPAVRERGGHGDEIASTAAPQFEHTAVVG